MSKRKHDDNAARNGYRLIVIPYTVVNIESFLRKRLGYLKEAA